MENWIKLLSVAAVAALVVFAIVRLWNPDERFKEYRRKSSRFALVAGLAAIVVLVTYRAAVYDQVSWDLMIVLGAIAVGKFGAMGYYQLRG